MDPAPGKDFSIETLKKVQEFLEGFTFPDGKAPPNLKKPLLIFVTFNDWLDHGFEEQKREWLENFLKPKSFYDLVEMFNAAFYLQIKDLKEIVAARIAHSISMVLLFFLNLSPRKKGSRGLFERLWNCH